MLNYQKDINDNPYPVCIDVCMVKKTYVHYSIADRTIEGFFRAYFKSLATANDEKEGRLSPLWHIFSDWLVHQSQWGMSEKGWTMSKLPKHQPVMG